MEASNLNEWKHQILILTDFQNVMLYMYFCTPVRLLKWVDNQEGVN